jgi:C-terminal peptidase prc
VLLPHIEWSKSMVSIARLRRGIAATMVVFAALSFAPSAPVMAKSPTPVAPASTTEKFDGLKLWQLTVNIIADNHLTLSEPAKRAQFRKDWLHRHDKDGALKTEAGTDAAIEEMLRSLGQRFDYYHDRRGTESFQGRIKGQQVGVGVKLGLVEEVDNTAATPVPDQLSDTPAVPPLKLTDADKAKLRELFKQLAKQQEIEEFRISAKRKLTVIEPLDGGPAEGKLVANDVIKAVNGKPVEGMQLDDASQAIRGKPGTNVDITVERVVDGAPTEVTVTLTRALVRVKVVHTKDLGDGVTYIKLDSFLSDYAADEMAEALKAAAKGKGIVFDLRGNPGGELQKALKIASFFIPDGTLLVTRNRVADGFTVTTTNVDPSLVTTITTTNVPGRVQFHVNERAPLLVPADLPVVLLVDDGSASASEIFAGVMRAHHRATIIGMHERFDTKKIAATHGKGVGQTVIPLLFGRELQLTSFQFMPSGVDMDVVGVMADVQVEASTDHDAGLDEAVRIIAPQITDAEAKAARLRQLEQERRAAFERRVH